MAVQRLDTSDSAPRAGGAADGGQATESIFVASILDAAVGERESNTQRAHREIRQRILVGEMPPGAQYLEQELAQMLGMSRTPVREALIRLADEHLVEVRPRHGARVLPVTPEDILEIYELLAELEGLAGRRMATQGATTAQLAALQEAREKMAAALKTGERSAWFSADQSFHATLVCSCGNTRLVRVVQGLADQSHWAKQQTLAKFVFSERADREHVEIIEAIKAHDADATGRLIQQHLMSGCTAMLDLLTARPANL